MIHILIRNSANTKNNDPVARRPACDETGRTNRNPEDRFGKEKYHKTFQNKKMQAKIETTIEDFLMSPFETGGVMVIFPLTAIFAFEVID